MKRLVKFYCDCGRMGDLSGLFVCEETALQEIIGEEVYFGDVLGNHSDVSLIMEQDHFSILSDEQDKIEWLVGIVDDSTISGYNPFDYIEDDDSEDE